MDMSQYRDLFVAETREYLGSMNESIVDLERGPGDREAIDSLFRFAHSIKGMAASMGYQDIAELAHAMEDLMDRVRKGDALPVAAVVDALLGGVDLLDEMVVAIEKGGTGCGNIAEVVLRLKRCSCAQGKDTDCRREDRKPEESHVHSKAADTGGGTETGEPEIGGGQSGALQTVRVKTEVLDNLINITGELITNRHRLLVLAHEMEMPGLNDAIGELSRNLRDLQGEVMKLRLMPFAVLADRFSRIVRDLASKSGKVAAMEIRGKDIGIDRGVLEKLADPLVHLLRNAVDHGLEKMEERLAAGKPPSGKITLEIAREKDHVAITVADDGRGMDPARLIESAIERKLVKPEDGRVISPKEAFMLTCIPGFSTAHRVTDISGRGVGMDVVRNSVQVLGGRISIDSEVGRGTRIAITVPLTVSIIHVLLVTCSDITVGFPIGRILRVLDVRRSQITSQGKRRVLRLDDEVISVLSLNRLLGVPHSRISGDFVPTIITELRGKKVGLVVDRFEGQREVFLKPLGRPMGSLKGAAGGAILGDGRAVIVLDTERLL